MAMPLKSPRGNHQGRFKYQQRQACLAQAEAKLVEFAASLGDPAIDALDIRTYDTKIPSQLIPIIRRKKETEANAPDSYLMHAVRVTNEGKFVKVIDTPKAPLVLLHGFMCGLAYWYRSFVSLSRVFPEIYALDLLGFGLSSRPKWTRRQENGEDIQIAESFFVESLEAWRVANNIDRMILVGHSFSGHISVAYAERYPEHVEQLVLVCPVGVTDIGEVPCKSELERILQHNPHAEEMRAKSRLAFTKVYKHLFEAGLMNGYALRKLPRRLGRWCVHRDVKRHCVLSSKNEQDALADYLYYSAMMPGSAEYTFHRLFRPCLYAKNPSQHRIPSLRVEGVAIVHGASDWVDNSGALQLMKSHGEGRFGSRYSFYEVDSGHHPMLDKPIELTATLAQIALQQSCKYELRQEECKQ